MRFDLPENVENIIQTLQNAGFEAYAVGGCVRDHLLGRIPGDYDITTSAKPQEVKSLFRRTIDTGIQHGTVTVMIGKEGYEITTYRLDGEYEDGRHPKEVTFTASLSEDLKRRDFTINAMAYNNKEGLVDLFGGQQDLENRIIRCVGQPQERFSEDALRMMRAVRFAAQLGFTMEENTFAAIKELAPTLSKVSAERIQVELVKLLVSPHPECLEQLYESGLTKVFMPELDKCMETQQNHPHHCYDVGHHIIQSIVESRAQKEIRLAMLFHDMGKPKCLTVDAEGITHFHGHPEVSGKMAKEILRRLKFDNATISMVEKLVLYHDRRIEVTAKALRRALSRMGEEVFPTLFEVQRADTLAQSDYLRQEKLDRIKALENLYHEIMERGECVSLKTLAVTGADLIKAGVKPGPMMGSILKELLEMVVDRPENNTKEILLEEVKKKR